MLGLLNKSIGESVLTPIVIYMFTQSIFTNSVFCAVIAVIRLGLWGKESAPVCQWIPHTPKLDEAIFLR